MGVNVEVLFYTPQREIASRLRDHIDRSVSVSMVSGFATPSGIDQISDPLVANPAKLASLVVGAGTFRAWRLSTVYWTPGWRPTSARRGAPGAAEGSREAL